MSIFNIFSKKKYDNDQLKIVEQADRGDENAKNIVLGWLDNGMTDEYLNNMRLFIYEKKANEGDDFAQNEMGGLCCYFLKDNVNGEKWFTNAAEQGNIFAMESLVRGYSEAGNNEHSIKLGSFGYNPEKELYWLNTGASLGYSYFHYNLGDHYRFDDDAKAMACYEEAIRCDTDLGSVIGSYRNLVSYYNESWTDHYEPQKAFDLCAKALFLLQDTHPFFGYDYLDDYHFLIADLGSICSHNVQKPNPVENRDITILCYLIASCGGVVTGAPDWLAQMGYSASPEEIESYRPYIINMRSPLDKDN